MIELFKGFEVNWEQRQPIILKLLGSSVVVHLILILSLLYVPGVKDVFNIAALLSDTKFVDKDYDRTVIGDDVQFVQISGAKFRYPDGYWALDGQTAEMFPPLPPTGAVPPPIPAAELFPPTAFPEPSVAPTAVPSPVPTSSPVTTVAQASASPTPSPVDKKVEAAQRQLEKTAEENNLTLPKEGEINKKALRDFAAYANDLKTQGKLDLDKPFEVVIEAELDGNGKLKDPKFTKKEGDPNLVDLFGRMVGALNDSGFLIYLKPIDKDNPGTKVIFTIKQGESEVLATVESEVSSDSSARLLAKGFNAALVIGAESRAGKDEEILLRNTSAEPNGKKITFNFTMPRQAVVDLIKRQLAAG
ncbi:MAG TPA: hypothetical protein VJU86_16700 [Pyrinomonadaceae bacterium]|nr:hypothetical protein [Pyrinomonadaceae bacterium]